MILEGILSSNSSGKRVLLLFFSLKRKSASKGRDGI
jgi:hypothetical protein